MYKKVTNYKKVKKLQKVTEILLTVRAGAGAGARA